MSIKNATPVWAIVSAHLNEPDDPSFVVYGLTFNGVKAAALTVSYEYNGCTTAIKFNRDHEANDGALVMHRAMNALYDNYDAQNLRTDGCFTFPYEAFEFLGAPLTFTY